MFIVVARQNSVTSKSEQIEFERQIDSNEQNVLFQTIPTITQARATIQVCNLTNASHYLTMPEIAITDLKKLLEDVEASGYPREKVDITSIFNENPLFYGQPGSSRRRLLQKRFYTLRRNSLSNYRK